MRILSTLTIISTFLFLAISCQKEDDARVDHLPRYVIRYEGPYIDTTHIEYSGNRLVRSIGHGYEVFYHYDKAGLPVSTSYIMEGREEAPLETYTYHNGKLVQIAVMSRDPESGSVWVNITMDYKYYGDTLITKEYKDEYDGSHYLEAMYLNGSANIYKSLKYYFHSDQDSMMLSYTTLFEYDNAPTPTSHIYKNHLLGNWNENNVLRQERYDPEGRSVNLQEFSYIYDEWDFPTVMISGQDTIEKYVYESTYPGS